MIILILDLTNLSVQALTIGKVYLNDGKDERYIYTNFILVHWPMFLAFLIKLYFGVRWCMKRKKKSSRRALVPYYRWSLTYLFSKVTGDGMIILISQTAEYVP